jgi:hypothetical protein
MNLPPTDRTLTLPRDGLLRLERPQGMHLTALRGTLWITVDGDPKDIELEAGAEHRFERRSPAIVSALGGQAVFRVRAGASAVQPRLAWA